MPDKEEKVKVEKEEAEKPNEDKLLKAGLYKGYSIRWLKKLGPEHPDFHLVAEFEKKYGEVK